MKQPTDDGRSLFDEPTPLREWHEVPAARFLSWTAAEQYAYCAARDENSALYADTDEDYMFYKRRAEMYRA